MNASLPRDSYDLLDKKAVLLKLCVGNTLLYEWIAKGLLTKQIKIGEKSVWPMHEINTICAARSAGMADAGVHDLVDRLHEEREQVLASMS